MALATNGAAQAAAARALHGLLARRGAARPPHLNDPEIRELLLATLRAARPGALLVQELELAGQGRADVAAIGRRFVEGYEIKSAADSMRRLTTQVPAYGRIFDWCTLVTSRSHMAHAARTLPPWWGLTLVEHGRLELARPPQQNLEARAVRLLWSGELRKLITQRGLRQQAIETGRRHGRSCKCHPSRFDKWTMIEVLATLPAAELGPIACEILKAREGWRLPDGRSVEGAKLRAAQAKRSTPRRAV